MTSLGLNPSQLEAVQSTEGPIMLLAGAGSGKTRTLVSRIKHLLVEKGASPWQVLAVTFSNKAAREMRERLAQMTEYDIASLQVTTFHSFCARLLRTEAHYLGLSKNFTIYDDSESNSVIKAVLARKGISQKDISPFTLSAYIDRAKNLGHWTGSPVPAELADDMDDPRFYSLFLEYESELHRSNAIDFGGLITGVLALFDSHPEVLKKYQDRFRYILVDEYQDTNRAQFSLVNLLAGKFRNICVVGDEDQSIYSWRGADIRNILDFEKIYPEAKLVKLEQNYRSSKTIISAASHLIANNVERKGKTMWTDNADGDSIQIIECRDDRGEADYVANEIKAKLSSGTAPGDIAVIYRNNAQSRSLEDALRRDKIPYNIVAGIKFYERKEIKDMLAYMRTVVNKKDSLALSRIINVPARGIGATSLRKLEDESVKQNCSLYEFLERLVATPTEYKHLGLGGKVLSGLSALVTIIQEVQGDDERQEAPHVSYERLLHESGYSELLKADRTYEGQARLENLEELSTAIKQYEERSERPSLLGFLEEITLDTTTEEAQGQQISLMTAHGSKGLEYPYVYIVGAEENLFPSYRSLELGGSAIEEERRLFYVAMTRAMKQLVITFAQGRMLWGSLKFNGPSQFIHEIPEASYQWKTFGTGKRTQGSSYDEFNQEFPDYDTSVYSAEKTYQQRPASSLSKFPAGTKIMHALYGEGKILDSEGSSDEEKVTILFAGGVRKKFMVKFAPIQKI